MNTITYGGSAIVAPASGSKRDKTSAEREAERIADRWPRAEMLRDLGLTAADLDAAMGFGFPSPAGRIEAGWGNLEPYWSKRAVEGWCSAIAMIAEKVK